MNEAQNRGANDEDASEDTVKRTRPSAASAGTETNMDVGELSVNQEEEVEVDEWAIDDLTGEDRDVQKVAAARNEEVRFMIGLGVRDLVVGGAPAYDRQGTDHDEVD